MYREASGDFLKPSSIIGEAPRGPVNSHHGPVDTQEDSLEPLGTASTRSRIDIVQSGIRIDSLIVV